MKYFKISIRRTAFVVFTTIGLLSILSISILWITTELSEHKERIEQFHESSMKSHRNVLMHEVERVISYINFSREQNTEETEDELQNRLLDHIATLHFEHGGYVFINTYQGKALVFDGKRIRHDKDISHLVDADGIRLFDLEMKAIKMSDGDYMRYRFKRMNSDTYEQKISFIKGYDDWNWIIGAGLYLNDTFKEIAEAEDLYVQKLHARIIRISLLFIALLLLIILMAYLLSAVINRDFKILRTFFNSASDGADRIDLDNLNVSEFKNLAATANEMLALRQSDSQEIISQRNTMQKYLDIVGVIVLALNKEATITLINKKGLEILGYNYHELIGENWGNNCLPPGERSNFRKRFNEVITGNQEIDAKSIAPVLTVTGEIRIIEWSNTVVLNEKGLITGTLSSGRDITLALKSEKALLESENKYRLLFEKSSDPVCIFNKNLVFVSCNEAALQYFGVTSNNELAGIPLDTLKDDKSPDNNLNIISEKASQTNTVGHARFEWLHKDFKGHDCYSDFSLTQIPIDGTTHIYAIIRDIQLEKQYESELIVARKKAEQSNQLKTNFINNMSHEVRTPLNTIMGFSQLLAQPQLTKNDLNLYIASIMNAGNNLTQIMDDIMDYSKYQAGELSLSPTPTHLKNLIIEVYRKHLKSVEKKSIGFKFHIPDNEAINMVITDGDRIKQVLSHLIDNACKFTFEGEISFGYSIRHHEILFQITDTGLGIEKQFTDQIFETFSQINNFSEDRVFGGTGLGLSISKAIVESMGGSIWLTSLPNEGSSFYFRIPYKPITNPQEFFTKQNSLSVKKIVGCISSTQKMAQELSNLLLIPELTIQYIKNGPTALERCRFASDILAVVIETENIKPNAAAYIKVLKRIAPHIIILAAVSKNNDVIKEDLIKSGCSGFVTIPIEINDLNAAIWSFSAKKKRLRQ